jgi:thioredoxin reductase (NADPH)
MGPDMMDEFRKQAQRFGAECLFKTVDKVDFSERPYKVWADGNEYSAEAIIISTGATARLLGLESESELMGHGVSACATCDGFFFRDKKVLVVGGGDSAMEEATFLTKFASEVVLIHRRDEFRASKIMIDRAMANPKISVEYNSNVDDIIGTKETGVTAVRLKDTISGAKRDVVCDGIFMAIGHKPNTQLFNGSIDLDNAGYIITNSDTTYTNLEGVFACGDVQDHVYRQAVTAAGTGCMAAIDAERWLEQETE